MIYKPQNVRKRATGKLARTSFVNEVVDALLTRAPVFGQIEPDSYQVPSVLFTARITAATQDGSNKRWAYTFVEVEKTVAAYGGWTDLSGGKTGTLYNKIEDQNGATGTYGNGVASTNLTGTFALKPIPTGTRVSVEVVTVKGATPATEYWTSYVNSVDGAC